MSQSIPLGSGLALSVGHCSSVVSSSFVPASSSASAACSYPFASTSIFPSAQVLASTLDLSVVEAPEPPEELEEAAAPANQPRKDVILVVDVSGSMSGVINQVRETVLQLGLNLTPRDRLAVVTFGSRGRVLMPLGPVPPENQFRTICEGIVIEGSTNMIEGLELGFGIVCSTSTENEDQAEGAVVSLMLLSDGIPDAGSHKTLENARKLASTVPPGVHLACHSFGYTHNHDATLLQALATLGTSGSGLFYFLQSEEDVPASVGDCLGASTNALIADLSLTMELIFDAGQLQNGEHYWTSHFPGGSEDQSYLPLAPSMSLGCLGNTQKQTAVVVHTPPADRCVLVGSPTTRPKGLKVTLRFFHLRRKEYVTEVLQFGMDEGEPQPTSFVLRPMFDLQTSLTSTKGKDGKGKEREEKQPGSEGEAPDASIGTTQNELHILTHLLRVRVGLGLAKFTDPAVREYLGMFEALHAALLEVLGLCQQVETDALTFDEGILQALETDLGAALESLSSKNDLFRLSGQFVQFSHEHLRQTSASSISNMRSTYSSPVQLSMRLRFLLSRGNPQKAGDAARDKLELKIEEDGQSQDALEKRREVDALQCFVTLETWREISLGMGILVRPRTVRERYRSLLPTIDLVEDYLSVEAYNVGVRANVTPAIVDRDDEDHQEENLAVKSSARSRINAWLPLYLNKEHWEIAKHFAPAAFSLIATQVNDVFQPIHTLLVCSRLMCATTVRFTINEGLMTEKATQMYCDVHRLFLEMMTAYSQVAQEADLKLQRFLESPGERCRRKTADLGDLIQYLTVSSKYTWDDLKEVYVQELVRRMARHAGFILVAPIESVEALLHEWEARVPDSGRVSMFNKMFLEVIARPPGKTIEDVKRDYDSRWGRLTESQMQSLKSGFREIMSASTVGDVLKGLGYSLSPPALAELLLWAIEYRDEGHTVYDGVPRKAGKRVKEWMAKHKLWLASSQNPPPEIPFAPPPPAPAPRHFSPITPFHNLMNADPSEVVVSDCSCKRCTKIKTTTHREAQWKEAKHAHVLPGHEDSPHQTTLFVQGYPPNVTQAQLEAVFSQFGKVMRVDYITKTSNGKSKGYCFVHFESQIGMKRAMTHFLEGRYYIGPEGSLQTGRGKPLVVDVVRHLADPSYLPKRLNGGRKRKLLPNQGLENPQLARLVVHEAWTSPDTLTQLCQELDLNSSAEVDGKALFGRAFQQPGTITVRKYRLLSMGERFDIPMKENATLALLVCRGTLWLEVKQEKPSGEEPPFRRRRFEPDPVQNQKEGQISKLVNTNTLVVMKSSSLGVTARFWEPAWVVACTFDPYFEKW